jgi:hypothetical protein
LCGVGVGVVGVGPTTRRRSVVGRWPARDALAHRTVSLEESSSWKLEVWFTPIVQQTSATDDQYKTKSSGSHPKILFTGVFIYAKGWIAYVIISYVSCYFTFCLVLCMFMSLRHQNRESQKDT